MTTLMFELQLDESLATDYLKADKKVKDDLNQWISQFIYRRLRRKESLDAMFRNMEEVGKEAEANGLTEEIIDEILAESEI